MNHVVSSILYSAQFLCFLSLFLFEYCKVTVETLQRILINEQVFPFSLGNCSLLMCDERNIFCLRILSSVGCRCCFDVVVFNQSETFMLLY